MGGWIDPSGGGGGSLSAEQIEDLLGVAYVSPAATLLVGYDDPGDRWTFDLNLAHSNTWTVQQLYTGNGGAGVSAGGIVNVQPTGAGAGIIVYSNQVAGAGRLLNLWVDNPLFNTAASHVDYDGIANAVEILHNTVNDASSEALDIDSQNLGDTVVGIRGRNDIRGTLKLSHNKKAGGAAASDANAAILRLNWEEDDAAATAIQGIYAYSEDGSPTTGDLITWYNGTSAIGNLRMRLDPNGRVVFPRYADEEVMRVGAPEAFGALAAQAQFFGPPANIVTARRTLNVMRSWVNVATPGAFTPGLQASLTLDNLIEASPFTANLVAASFNSAIGQTTPIKGSVNNITTHLLAYGLTDPLDEMSYLQGSVRDMTAAGQPHMRGWGMDLGVEGFAGNEQQSMLHNLSVHLNNHFDGQPSAGDAIGASISTGMNLGPNPHVGVNTYPGYAGLGVSGVATNPGGATKAYGWIYGLKVGQLRPPWANATKVEVGAGLWDWGHRGLEVGSRYAGAAEVDPWAIYVTELGVNLGGFLAHRRQDLALVNGVNNDVAASGTLVRITGPTAAFSIASILPVGYSAPLDGMRVVLQNVSLQAMTITNGAATGTATARIFTASTGNRVGTVGHYSTWEGVYDASTNRWREVSWTD